MKKRKLKLFMPLLIIAVLWLDVGNPNQNQRNRDKIHGIIKKS